MAQYVTYTSGAELPDLALTWRDSTNAIIDYSSGWTFTVKIGVLGSAAVLTKTTGITGASTAPNVTIAWATSSELALLTVGTEYSLQVIARRTSDSKDRYYPVPVFITVGVGVT